MHLLTKLILCSLLVTISTVAQVEENAPPKDPKTFSKDERKIIYQARADYQQCLQENAVGLIEQKTVTDPRHVMSHAMQGCATVLEALHKTLIDKGFSKDAIGALTWKMSNRVSGSFLANLMRYMANRQGSHLE